MNDNDEDDYSHINAHLLVNYKYKMTLTKLITLKN